LVAISIRGSFSLTVQPLKYNMESYTFISLLS